MSLPSEKKDAIKKKYADMALALYSFMPQKYDVEVTVTQDNGLFIVTDEYGKKAIGYSQAEALEIMHDFQMDLFAGEASEIELVIKGQS